MRPNSSSVTPPLSLLLSFAPSALPFFTTAIRSPELPMYPSTTARIHAMPLPLRGISVQPHLPAARRSSAGLLAPAAALRSFSSLLHPNLRSAAAVARRGGPAPAQRFVTCAAAAATAEEAFVKKTVLEHDVVIFSKTYCPYCSRAKSVFKELNKVPFVVELDTRDDGHDIQDALVKMVGRRTVPQVFIKGKHLGGSDDTVEAYASGKLVELLGN